MQAAKQRHRHVGMTVDESGDDHLAVGVDGFRRAVFRFDLVTWADRNDGVTFDGDRPVVISRAGSVHGED